MARQGKQAISKTRIQASRQAKQRLFLRLTYIVLFISLVAWGVSLIRNPNFFPVRQVVIRGSYPHVEPQTLKVLIQPFTHTGLFLFNVHKLRQELEALPWIESAEIHRRWPDKISITLAEKVPVAKWGTKGLVTQRGEVFFPSGAGHRLDLPQIWTRPDLIPQALVLLNEAGLQLSVINLKVWSLKLTGREALSLVLTPTANSRNTPHFRLLLGHTETQMRLKRFIEVYPNVFESRLNEVQYVDMRYTNGMAVKWIGKN